MATATPPTATLPARDQIDNNEKWNRESVFPSRDAWRESAEKAPEWFPKISAFKGRLSEGASTLADYVEIQDQASRHLLKLYFYAAMEAAVDSNDEEVMAMMGQVGAMFGQFGAVSAFTNPELIAIGRETLDAWIAEEPRLKDYTQMIDNLFRRQAHVRSDEVEEILGMLADPFNASGNVFEMLTSSDMKFDPAIDSDGGEHAVAQGTIDTMYDNPDREVRRTAYESYTGKYLELKNTLAAAYITSVKQDIFYARSRGYESSLHASLFENNIPVSVYHNLLDTFKSNLGTWHKYWDVRRKVLGVDAHRPYDIWAPLTSERQPVSYEQSVEWISHGLKPLGDDYVNAMRQGCLEDRWVDRSVNDGKRQGAFSFGTYDTFPFIMMSYDDSLGAMSTLAHELGHSMHSYLSRKNQAPVNARYTLFAAEVASNFNQAMTRAYLREEKADDTVFQINLISEAMDNFHRYFLIMPTLARFELEVHNRVEAGQGLTANDLNSLCADLFAEAYGDTMDYDRERVGITWATFGHLYSAFYTYSYATGISAAHELAKHILAGEDGAAERYLDFLKMGGSHYPIDALNHAGVDMNGPAAVETTFGVLAEMVDRLAKLAGV